MLSRASLLLLNGATLTVCAVFDYAWRTQVLIGLMLFLPLLDHNGSLATLIFKTRQYILWGSLASAGILLILVNPDYINAALYTLLFAAVPEEWFFRAYFMPRLSSYLKLLTNRGSSTLAQENLLSNIMTSALFTLLHLPTQGWVGLLVFLPSLFYGWIFQKSNDLILVILLHALSNIVFFIFQGL